MRYMTGLLAAVLVAAMGGVGLAAERVALADIDRAVAALADYELGKPRRPLWEVEQIINATHGDTQLREHLERRLLRLLESPGATYECRYFICNQLAGIGTDLAVPVLAKMLPDEASSHMACLALSGNRSEAAAKALRDVAAQAGGKARLCIVGAIGDRRDAAAVEMLSRMMKDADPDVADAAITALGKIGTADVATLLADARRSSEGRARASLTNAYLQCAARLANSGHRDQATAMYRALLGKDESILHSRAALSGLLCMGGPEAAELVLATLSGGDRVLQATAIGHVRLLKGEGLTQRFAAELSKLPEPLQAMMIEALEDRADPAARQAVTAAAASPSAEVRQAAIKALAVLGDAASIPVLISSAQGAEEGDRRVALAALRRIGGDGVEAAIVRQMQQAGGELRGQLIGVINDRMIVAAVPALLAEARSDNAGVRLAALKTLTNLVQGKDLAALLGLLPGVAPGADRDELERALIAAARQGGQSAPLIDAMNAAREPAMRQSLLRVLGGLGDAPAFAAVHAALGDPSVEIRDTAVRVLADWPSPVAAAALLSIIDKSQEPAHRVLALRGYLRLAPLFSEDSPEARQERYAQALKRAGRPEERKLVLAGLASTGSALALRLIEPMLDEPAVSAEAVAATVRIAREAGMTNPVESAAALLKALTVAKEGAVREEIAGLLAKMDPKLPDSMRPRALFDGRSFAGWEGPTTAFRIEDEAIVGGSLKAPIPRNEFMSTRQEFGDFELRLKFRVLGENVNAGIQIRSQRIPNHNEMIGYQADIGQHYWGALYDESRRNKVLAQGDLAQIKAAVKANDWNDYVIRCRGPRIELWINGLKTVDYTEQDKSIPLKGVIGLQIHSGGPSEAWYKQIVIRELP